jgi:predicted MFS family arabinose efflux permease
VKRNCGFLILAITVFFLNLSVGLNSSIFNNFISQELKLQPSQLGILEAFRETPGLLMAFITAILISFKKQYLAFLSFILVSIGFNLYSKVTDLSGLISAGVTWSLGLHCWMTLSPIFTLGLVKDSERGRSLGKITSVSSFASLASMGMVLILGNKIPYRSYYLLAGLFPLISSILILKVPYSPRATIDPPPLVFKKKYTLYYVLNFLDGSRRQIFATFALFVLTKIYKVPVQYVALLLIINSIVNMTIAPNAGKLIDRFGERHILVLSYLGVLFIFIGYVLARSVPVLSILYCLDNVLFNFSIALTTYIAQISLPEDLSPNISMGITVNHIAAVTMPIIGGMLWERFNYQTMFLLGTVIVGISILASSRIKVSNL